MTTPSVGVTHDLVIITPSNEFCGLVFRPGSLRVQYQPTLLPRITMGDPTGLDGSVWRSFVQQDFSAGAGHYFYSSPHGGPGCAFLTGFDTANVSLLNTPAETINAVRLQSAVMPVCTSVIANMAASFSKSMPLFIMEMSGKPLVISHNEAYAYTGMVGPDVWTSGIRAGLQNALTGMFVPLPTFSNTGTGMVSHAMYFSQTVITVSSEVINTYGTLYNTTTPGSTIPTYNTTTTKVFVYDEKLWRSHKGRIAYLRPGYETIESSWTDFFDVGDPNEDIKATAVFAGRLYMGKADGIYVFDAGRVYQIQEYYSEKDDTNFSLFQIFRGALYFNIRGDLYRLTSGGFVEKVKVPAYNGYIASGTVIEGLLVFLVMEDGETHSSTWFFDPESGSTKKWFSGNELSLPGVLPKTLGSVRSYVFIGPMAHTQYVNVANVYSPIAGANLSRSPLLFERLYMQQSVLITPILDFGLASVNKKYHEITLNFHTPVGARVDGFYRQPNGYLVPDLKGLYTAATWASFKAVYATSYIDVGGKFRRSQIRFSQFNELVQRPKPQVVFIAQKDDDRTATDRVFNTCNPYYMKINGGWTPIPPEHYQYTKDFRLEPGYGGPTTYHRLIVLASQLADWDGQLEMHFDVTSTYGSGYPYNVNAMWNTCQIRNNGTDPENEEYWTRMAYVSSVRNKAVWGLPMDFLSKDIQFKFVITSDENPSENPNQIVDYQIKYMPVTSNKLRIQGVVIAANGIQTLDGLLENSATWIRTTMFSFISTAQTCTIQVPYPTIRWVQAQLGFVSPGAVPLLNYGEGDHNNCEGELSIAVDEI